jgi:hypothetical protein
MNMHVTSWEAFLFAVVDGEMNSKSFERMLKITSSIAAKKGISKILIDGSRVTGNPSSAERVEVATKLADHINKSGAKPSIALVGHSPTFNGLGVLAGRSRGINAMLFDSIPEALTWLRRSHMSEKGFIRAKSAHAFARNAHPH